MNAYFPVGLPVGLPVGSLDFGLFVQQHGSTFLFNTFLQ